MAMADPSKSDAAPEHVVHIQADCCFEPLPGGDAAVCVAASASPPPKGAPAARGDAGAADATPPVDVAGGEPPARQQGLTFDDALEHYVGGFGRGQLVNFLLACSVWLPGAVLVLLLVFSLGSPAQERHWECVDASDAACAAALAGAEPAAALCGLRREQWRWTRPHESLTAEFDLVCDGAWRAQIANSFFFVGYGAGSGIFGYVSNRFGRKGCMFGATVVSAAFTAAGTACTTYWAWLVMRSLAGIGSAGTGLGAFVLATEAIGSRWRGAAAIFTQLWFIGGEFLLVLVSVLFARWRSQAAACALLLSALLLLWPLLPESGRWLLAHGRKEEAMLVLERLARRNGTRAPDRPLADMAPRGGGASGAAARPLTLGAALRDWHIARRFLVLTWAWMVMCLAYYGISFALGSLGGNLRVSFMLSAIAELPSYLFAAWAIDHLGRHNTMAGMLLVGGAACTGCAFVAPGGGHMGLAAVGKFGISGAFAVASIYTSELFPTLIRTSVLGAENQAARIGAIAAPFIILAGGGSGGGGGGGAVPFLTMGAAALLAGLLCFTLPETLGTPLPDTMADMGNIASIFTHKTLEKKGVRAAASSMFKTRVRLGGGAGGAAGGAGGAARAWGWPRRARLREEGRQPMSMWEEDEVDPSDGGGPCSPAASPPAAPNENAAAAGVQGGPGAPGGGGGHEGV